MCRGVGERRRERGRAAAGSYPMITKNSNTAVALSAVKRREIHTSSRLKLWEARHRKRRALRQKQEEEEEERDTGVGK